MAARFRASLRMFARDTMRRNSSRTLMVATNIDHIIIEFQNQFNKNIFGKIYLRNFGLEAVRLSYFNTVVLFAIVDIERFNVFMNQVQLFIDEAQLDKDQQTFDRKISYIKSFRLLTTNRIIDYHVINNVVRFSLIEGLYSYNKYSQIIEELVLFLNGIGARYQLNQEDLFLEIEEVSEAQVLEILNNFDTVSSATSSLSTVIVPSKFGLPERSYGFSVLSEDATPLIGVIDTGVDARTPLIDLIVDTIDYTNTNALEDNVDHGTAVAALATLGLNPYASDYRGIINADAQIVVIKVMDVSPAPLPDHIIINAIKEAKNRHPTLKFFTLTICHEEHKKFNELQSNYAYLLDKVAHELDVLLFISAGNARAENDLHQYDATYHAVEKTNLCPPGESMNNITIGACADNLEGGIYHGICPLKEYPTLYSRTDYLMQESIFAPTKRNNHLRKPDFIMPGGDYEQHPLFIGQDDLASLQVLSSNPAFSFYRQIGTSFSAPLASNLALKIQKTYPNLNTQSIKAIILNSCSLNWLENGSKQLVAKSIGFGIPDRAKALYSTNNSVTFILERAIKHKEFLVIPIQLPEYIYTQSKDKGLIKVTASLCFSFLPNKDNHIAYCPLFMAFSVFRNGTPQQIMNGYAKNFKLRKSFSQDGYAKSKPGLYSNVQQLQFTISKTDIIKENGLLKLAIHCFLSPQIKAGIQEMRERINTENAFSIALRIEEIQPPNKLTGRLYDNIIAVNTIESIATLDIDEGQLQLEL